MNSRTLKTIQGTIQDVRYMVEPVVSDPTKTTLFNRIGNFFNSWTETSYNAWAKTDRAKYL